jgi:hypothetical protein
VEEFREYLAESLFHVDQKFGWRERNMAGGMECGDPFVARHYCYLYVLIPIPKNSCYKTAAKNR